MSIAPRSSRAQAICLALSLSIGVAACQSYPVSNGSELPPEPTARVEEHGLEIYFATDQAEITAGEAQKLEQFLNANAPGRGSIIAISGHADYRASDSYNLALSKRRVDAVKAQILALGYRDARIETRAYGERGAAQPPATQAAMAKDRRAAVRVRLYVSVTPPCPDWSRPVAYDPQNLPSSNLGCATANNLAEMVADPRNLVAGNELGPGDGSQAVGAVERYRTDEVKDLNKELASQ